MHPSPKLCARGKDSYFCRHFGNGSFQEKTAAEKIRRAVISVAFPKADCKVQVHLLSGMVFQAHCPLPLRNGDVTLAC